MDHRRFSSATIASCTIVGMRRISHIAILMSSIALMAGVVVACSSSDDTRSADPTPTDTTEWSMSTEDSIALALEDELVTPKDQLEIGQELHLTDAGPTPSTLIAIQKRDLTIVNDTDEPQTLHFLNAEVDDQGGRTIGPIPPGAKRTFVPPFPISMTYNLTGGDEVAGTLQIDTGEED
jgi:hypothetical protein